MEQQKVYAFLMFAGQAEQAMQLYTSVFADSEMIHVASYEDGSVMHATFKIKGQLLMCIDSKENHGFTFTPAMSLFITCDDSAEIENLYKQLAEGGSVLMPLAATPVSEKFAWVEDRFGVSWQLNLPKV